jgi:hypothetical protein
MTNLRQIGRGGEIMSIGDKTGTGDNGAMEDIAIKSQVLCGYLQSERIADALASTSAALPESHDS